MPTSSSTRTGRRGRPQSVHKAAGFLAGKNSLMIATAIIAALLTVYGLVMIYSASSVEAMIDFNDPMYYFKRQLINAAIGVVACVGLYNIPLNKNPRLWGTVAWGIIMFLLILVPLMGYSVYGAQRWVSLGPISLQPSELAKPVLIFVAAAIFSARYETGDIASGRQFALTIAAGIFAPLLLIVLEPDMGTTVIIAGACFVLFFLMEQDNSIIKILLGLAAIGIIVLIVSEPWRLARFAIAFNPESDPYNLGYQPLQGRYALGSGGFFGLGLGNSRAKYAYLPMAANDYILAVIGEELGLIGILVLVALFVALIWLGFKVAHESNNMVSRLVCIGAVSCIVIQAFINSLGVVGLIPMSGKPLPFISYGGTSIIATLALVGLVLSSAHYGTKEAEVLTRRSSLHVVDSQALKGRERGLNADVQRGETRGRSRDRDRNDRNNSNVYKL